jgi:hypothetical protein
LGVSKDNHTKSAPCRHRTASVRHHGIQTWDGKKWNIVSGWITADDSIIAPMVKEAATKYAAEKKITAGCRPVRAATD